MKTQLLAERCKPFFCPATNQSHSQIRGETMLKKISEYTAHFLFHVRHNFLSFLFKSSVFLTLLTLIYLVCILKHTNSVQKSPQIDVQQIAKSQKLTLRIGNKSDIATSDSEKPARVENYIPRKKIRVGSHPFFPIQKSTTPATTTTEEDTTVMSQTMEVTTSEAEEETTLPFFTIPEEETTTVTLPSTTPVSEETTLTSSKRHPLFPIQEQTTPVVEATTEYQTEDDLFYMDNETTSTLPSQEETTCLPEATTIAVAPFKRSLTLEELKFFETTTSLPDDDAEQTDDCLIESTTPSADESEEISAEVTTEGPEMTNLFGDEGAETDDPSPDENSLELEAETNPETDPETEEPENLFEDDETELEAPSTDSERGEGNEETQPADDDQGSEEETVPDDETVPDQETISNQETDCDQPEEEQTNPLFNLFSFDHVPATSNIKASQWTTSDGRQVNAISQLPDQADEQTKPLPPGFFRRLNRYQPLNSFMNMKIKDSVSLLEKLFGNFLT